MVVVTPNPAATTTPAQTATVVTPKPATVTTWDKVRPFVIGGLSGMFATTVVQPIDTVKVRIQISGENKGKELSAPTLLLLEERS